MTAVKVCVVMVCFLVGATAAAYELGRRAGARRLATSASAWAPDAASFSLNGIPGQRVRSAVLIDNTSLYVAQFEYDMGPLAARQSMLFVCLRNGGPQAHCTVIPYSGHGDTRP
jgi:hypothetical protein